MQRGKMQDNSTNLNSDTYNLNQNEYCFYKNCLEFLEGLNRFFTIYWLVHMDQVLRELRIERVLKTKLSEYVNQSKLMESAVNYLYCNYQLFLTKVWSILR